MCKLERELSSSQASEPVIVPLAQILYPGSILQVDEQPSPSLRLPSSHCSLPSFFPSPHYFLLVLLVVPEELETFSKLHTLLVPSDPLHVQPVSTKH